MSEWVKRYNVWVAREPSRPGIWRRQGGGYFLRKRVVDPATGAMVEIVKTLPDADLATAEARLAEEVERVKTGDSKRPDPSKMRFSAYAALLFERKVKSGDLKSSQSVGKWAATLERHLIPRFGNIFLTRLRATEVEAWKAELAERGIKTGKPAPTSVNTWLDVLRVIAAAAVAEFDLPKNPLASVKNVNTSTWRTYTEEQPNSLTPAEARKFLAKMAELYPQHLAMTLLGFATGLRPSHMRPLRRTGETPDVLWTQGVLLVRRSQTKGEAMDKTKTSKDQRLHLPLELMRVLGWHVDRLPSGPAQTSELLFPSATGGYRSRSCLDKPFERVAAAIGLKKRITPRGMRRSYQDLMRAANVDGLIVRAISGHATREMQDHYSTVSPTEMRAAMLRVATQAGFDEAIERAGPEPFRLAGPRLPEGERKRLYTPKKYRLGPGPVPAGREPGSGGEHGPAHGPSGEHGGEHRPDGGDGDGGRSRI